MEDNSIGEAFREVEDYLIGRMISGLSNRSSEDITRWQAEQMAALAEFRADNRQKLGGYFGEVNSRIEGAIRAAYKQGEEAQEREIQQAIKNGWSGKRAAVSEEFSRVNERELNACIDAVKRDMERSENALLRMADDQYRKAIFNAGVAYNTGAYTLPQAIDTATKEFLERGLNCIEYRNGARVPIDSYAEMALRTSATHARLMGESSARDKWGVNTVIVNKHGVACPKCLRYVGKVFYDDVYGNVPVTDDKYPRLSSAIAGGLYHPNCKDIHTTYFEGVSAPPSELTEEEKQEAEESYALEQRQRYNERQIRKYKRLTEGTLDPDEKAKYAARLKQWEQVNNDLIEQHGDVLRNRAEREKVRGLNITVPKPLTEGENGGIIKIDNSEPNKEERVAEPDSRTYRYGTSEDYSRMLKSHTKNVPESDRKQIFRHSKPDGASGGYVSTHNYSNINSNLRGDGYSVQGLDDDDIRTIGALRSAINSNTLDDNYILTRYVDVGYLSSVFGATDKYGNAFYYNGAFEDSRVMEHAVQQMKDKIGTTVQEKAFVSTSVLKDKNIMTGKGVRLTINAPAGTNCYIPKNKKESECILGENTAFYITDVRESPLDRKLEIFVTVMEEK